MWIINKTINFFWDVHNEVKSDAHSSRNSEIVSLVERPEFFSEWNKSKILSEISFPLVSINAMEPDTFAIASMRILFVSCQPISVAVAKTGFYYAVR